jgi:hypothetical protein
VRPYEGPVADRYNAILPRLQEEAAKALQHQEYNRWFGGQNGDVRPQAGASFGAPDIDLDRVLDGSGVTVGDRLARLNMPDYGP